MNLACDFSETRLREDKPQTDLKGTSPLKRYILKRVAEIEIKIRN